MTGGKCEGPGRKRVFRLLLPLVVAVALGCGSDSNAAPGAIEPTPRPASGADEQSPTLKLLPLGGAPIEVTVEVVATPALRQRGLMFREELPEGTGMLFVFPRSQPLSFWMRNTLIPLDILYIEEGGRIIRIHRETTPFSEEGLPSGGPARFVLEVPGGWTAKVGVREGDRVELGTLAATPAT